MYSDHRFHWVQPRSDPEQLGSSAHSWSLSLQPAAGLVIFHITTGSSGLERYSIPLILIHKAIKFPYYKCRKTKTIISEIKNVLVRYFIKACLYRNVYLRFFEMMNFTKNKNSCSCLCINYKKKHYLKNNRLNYHSLLVPKSCLVTSFLSVATKSKLHF